MRRPGLVDLAPGCSVYGSRGGFIGFVEVAGPSLLRVRGRSPFAPLYYVPRSAIVGTLGGGREIFLGCRVDELDRQGWLVPPRPESDAT